MSGGAFDYAYHHIGNMADELEKKITADYDPQDGYHLDPHTLDRMRVLLAILRAAKDMSYSAEWLYSGDTGEEQFGADFDKALDELMESIA